jgi:DNA adenine methylase
MYRQQDSNLATEWPVTEPSKELCLADQVGAFPTTRFMGSKEQLLLPLWRAIGEFSPSSVLDLCSGTAVVSYMLKAQGCRVYSNDYMKMATTIAEATIQNSDVCLTDEDIAAVANARPANDRLIERTYGELYFDLPDVQFLDNAREVIGLWSGAKRSLALAGLIRSCLKRRPRGIFTYTGRRYDDGRRDLQLSLREHFTKAAHQLNCAVFNNGQRCEVFNVDLSHGLPDVEPDVVYLDPPYFSPLSDNEYVRRYHFTEALACDWQGVEIQHHTKTKKIKNYPSPFRSELGCLKAVGEIIDRYRQSAIVISYSSNSLPTASDMLAHVRRHGRKPSVIEVDHRYSFANQGNARRPVRNKVKELIFTAE